MKLNFILFILFVWLVSLSKCFGGIANSCSDEELVAAIKKVMATDLAIQGNFNLTLEQKEVFAKAAHELSETLKRCESAEEKIMLLSKFLTQKISRLRSKDFGRNGTLPHAKVLRLVFTVLRIRAIEEKALILNSEQYAITVLNIYNLLIDHLLDFFLTAQKTSNVFSMILTSKEVAYYIIFLINFMELDFLGFESMQKHIHGDVLLEIEKLRDILSKQLNTTGGIPAQDVHTLLASLLSAIERSLYLKENSIGSNASDPNIRLAYSMFMETLSNLKHATTNDVDPHILLFEAETYNPFTFSDGSKNYSTAYNQTFGNK